MNLWNRIKARLASRRDLHQRQDAVRDALSVATVAFRRVVDSGGHLPVWAAQNALYAIEQVDKKGR